MWKTYEREKSFLILHAFHPLSRTLVLQAAPYQTCVDSFVLFNLDAFVVGVATLENWNQTYWCPRLLLILSPGSILFQAHFVESVFQLFHGSIECCYQFHTIFPKKVLMLKIILTERYFQDQRSSEDWFYFRSHFRLVSSVTVLINTENIYKTGFIVLGNGSRAILVPYTNQSILPLILENNSFAIHSTLYKEIVPQSWLHKMGQCTTFALLSFLIRLFSLF